MRRIAAVVAAALLVAGCGGSKRSSAPSIRVAAASSLQDVLNGCAPRFTGATVRLEFAGSDELAAQIRAGVKPEVYMAANTSLPRKLAQEGKVDAPVPFASNQLVVAVPAGDRTIHSIGDLARGNPTIAIGSVSVPIGIYTRQVIARLPLDERIAVLAHVRSQEPDVKGVIGKLVSQTVSAGFVYRSDVQATGGKLRAISLPASLEPTVTYSLETVKGSPQPAAARRFVADVLNGGCAQALRAAGLGPPPK
jgi:molybdate transport system substrate-binding protein